MEPACDQRRSQKRICLHHRRGLIPLANSTFLYQLFLEHYGNVRSPLCRQYLWGLMPLISLTPDAPYGDLVWGAQVSRSIPPTNLHEILTMKTRHPTPTSSVKSPSSTLPLQFSLYSLIMATSLSKVIEFPSPTPVQPLTLHPRLCQPLELHQ